MSIRQTGAEFFKTDTRLPTDLVEIQRFSAPNGFYVTQNIEVEDLLAPDYVQVNIAKITELAGAVTVLFNAPFDGEILSVKGTLGGAITTSSVVITPSIYHGGTPTAVTGGVVTIPVAGSGVGVSVTATPTNNKTFEAGDIITATITGAEGATGGLITLLFKRV